VNARGRARKPGTPKATRDGVHPKGITRGPLTLLPKVPHDLEAELSVLAELADPTYKIAALADVTADCFYDERMARIFKAISTSASTDLSTDDSHYLQNAVRYAWPLSSRLLESFLDCAAKRRRLFDLERERLALLGVSA
jgi:hypothetical protein